ncbi:MAG TPA: pyridoxal-phosphate dependent enzyme [Ktedonosporobacter sp.]|nr:pyridoxal-phosphate dependent enzyme [Ktedonosporobacter sp.]
MYATNLRCYYCSTEYPLTNLSACPVCAKPGEESALNETLGVEYDVPALKRQLDRDEMERRPAGLWRYQELLPIANPEFQIATGAGGTRLARLARLPEQFAWMKVEGSNPSGSFKDRPITVAACVALERGARTLACLTSGNIGSALAAVAAKAGVPALVMLLASAGGVAQGVAVSMEKYVQVSAYGATVVTPVGGDLGKLYTLADTIEEEFGWLFMHTMQAYQPDGDKTTAFEICEQLDWKAPAAVFVPTGTGTNLFGMWQGFMLFKELGFIDRVPRMFAVQPVGAASLSVAMDAGLEVPAVLAQAIPNSAPPISHRVSGYHAYKAIRESGGDAVAVSDDEMLTALKDLAAYEGIYCEVASASALAGIRRALTRKLLDEEEARQYGVVGVLTSHGLKNTLALSRQFSAPTQVEASWKALLPYVRGVESKN